MARLLGAYPHPLPRVQICMSDAELDLALDELRACGFVVEQMAGQLQLASWPDLLLPELLDHYRPPGALFPSAVCYRETLDSTNILAKELARQGAASGTLVVAEEQTAGRGRRGRSWSSSKGQGIWVSLLLQSSLPADRLPWLTLLAGIAVVEAVQAAGLRDAWLKWPNDVWVERRKLCGILTEVAGQRQGATAVIIGIGVNIHQESFPAEIAASATSFYRETGRRIYRAALLADILHRLETLLPLAADPEAQPFLDRWSRHDRLLGQPVAVLAADRSYRGIARGLTPGGALQIERDDGTLETLLAGDISLRPGVPDKENDKPFYSV